ncbi:MAG TPA: MtrB/PioB family outer membrane beta-barrel protein [Rhizomicrobium sp.]|jgi:MtrB/PioB family decaheme-associated outer membrane protein
MTRRAFLFYGQVSLTALGLFSGAARADTSVLGYGGPGNLLNPGGLPLDLARDADGLSQLNDVSRTPTGLLYPLPYAYPAMTQSKDDPDWWTSAWVQGGLMGSFGAKARSASFRKYADWSSGPLLASAGFLAQNRRTAYYVSGLVENAGRSDQYYQLQAGRYGEFRLTAFFDSIPHEYSSEARSIWNGAGSDNLTLRNGLVPGASTRAQVTAVAEAAPLTEVKVTREKAGMSFSYTPWETIELFAQLTHEWRDGTLPISATFGYPFQNGATQILQPVHYRTFDVTTALRYKDDEIQANLTYVGSFFNNQYNSLTWQNPGLEASGLPAGAYIPPAGRLSLPPSNSYNSLKGDMSALLSPDIRFSGSLSYSLMRQDDALMPPTLGTGVIPGAGGPINLANWNTTAALGQQNAHAAIDVFNAFAQLQYVVSTKITLDFELRDRNEMNRTNYVAYNPVTNQYGYVAIDGGLAPFSPLLSGVYQPNARGDVVQIQNLPFANDNLELSARASYRLDNHMKLDLSFVHNSIEHSVREVADADDNRARLQLAATGYRWGSVRVSYEFASLSGSDYMSNPYTSYYSTSLPGYLPKSASGDVPFTLDALRKFDVGDRTEHVLHAQANYILSERTDLQFTGDYKADEYDARYGLRSASTYDVNADINYQISTTATLTGFFTFQTTHRSVAGINDIGASGSAAPGGPNFPLANGWNQVLGDHNYTAGLTAHKAWDKISLDVNYIYTRGDSAYGYGYASTGAFFNQLTASQAGNAFPDITFESHSLEASTRWQAAPNLAYRLMYRLDFQNLDDFHYDNLTPVISNNTYLGVVPENFTVQTFGLSIQYTF